MKVLKFFILAVVLSSCSNFTALDKKANYKEALALYRGEEYDDALDKLKFVIDDVEIEQSQFMADALYLRGFIYYLQDKSKKAYSDYLEAIEIARIVGNEKMTSRLNNEIGQIFFEKELYDQSLLHFKLALSQSDDEAIQDRAYFNYGVGKSLRKIGRLEEGMDFLLKAVDVDTELKNYDALAGDLIELGITQFDAGNYDQAISHYRKVIEIAPLTRKKNPHLWRAYNNIGNTYLAQNKLFTAEENLLKSLEFKGSENQLWITYNNLGKVYNTKGDYNKAWNCFKQSLAYNSKKGEVNELAITNYALKKTFEKLNQPDSLLYYTMLINDMALPMVQTKSWLKDEEEKIALLTKYQDYITERSEKEQYAKTSWLTAFIMTFIFVSGVLSMRLWKIYNYKSPKAGHALIKNSNEMVYLLDMFKKEKEEMKKVMDQLRA